jgi:hypothetical protein
MRQRHVYSYILHISRQMIRVMGMTIRVNR